VTRRTVEDQYPEWFRPRPTIKFCRLAVHGPRGICGTAVALPRLPQRKPKSRMEELKAAHRRLTSSCGLAATGTDCRDSSHNVCAPLGSGCSATRQHGDVGVPEALNVQPTRQPLLHRSLRTALPPSAATLDAYARAHGLGKNAPLPASNYLKDGTRRAELCVRVRDNPNSHPPPVTRRELCIGKS
jgi:hypothetical protein